MITCLLEWAWGMIYSLPRTVMWTWSKLSWCLYYLFIGLFVTVSGVTLSDTGHHPRRLHCRELNLCVLQPAVSTVGNSAGMKSEDFGKLYSKWKWVTLVTFIRPDLCLYLLGGTCLSPEGFSGMGGGGMFWRWPNSHLFPGLIYQPSLFLLLGVWCNFCHLSVLISDELSAISQSLFHPSLEELSIVLASLVLSIFQVLLRAGQCGASHSQKTELLSENGVGVRAKIFLFSFISRRYWQGPGVSFLKNKVKI